MKTALRIFLLAGAAGLGFWLWMTLFPSPEKIVLKKISRLAAAASFDASTSNITRAGKASEVVALFASDAQIVVDVTSAGVRTLNGREEIREAALGGFASVHSLNVRFIDLSVKVGGDQQSAEVNCTAEVRGGESKDFGVEEMRFQFRKIDKDWLITRAETVKTLQ
jgi:ketosteroid isomerase-like protein